jgi:phospholipase/carboxylesterase
LPRWALDETVFEVPSFLRTFAAVSTAWLALVGCGAAPTEAPEVAVVAPPNDAIEMTTAGAPADAPLPLLVGLHSRNGSPESLVPILSRIQVPARVVLFRGESLGEGRFTWWREASKDEGDDATAAATARRAGEMAAMVKALMRTRATRGRPVLFGRSQGGNLALAMALRDPGSVGAVFVMSSVLLPPMFALTTPPASGARPPIFAFHGDADDRVPIERARETAEKMRALGFAFDLTEYPGMSHVVDERELVKALPEVEAALRREAAR